MFKITNMSNGNIIADQAAYADTFISRLRGLMFRNNFNKGEALVIIPCNSIHTFWMKFPIDVVFLSKENTVIYIIENFQPNKISPLFRKAHSVVELPIGTIKECSIKQGDVFAFDKIKN